MGQARPAWGHPSWGHLFWYRPSEGVGLLDQVEVVQEQDLGSEVGPLQERVRVQVQVQEQEQEEGRHASAAHLRIGQSRVPALRLNL